jgi:ribosomal protein L29
VLYYKGRANKFWESGLADRFFLCGKLPFQLLTVCYIVAMTRTTRQQLRHDEKMQLVSIIDELKEELECLRFEHDLTIQANTQLLNRITELQDIIVKQDEWLDTLKKASNSKLNTDIPLKHLVDLSTGG